MKNTTILVLSTLAVSGVVLAREANNTVDVWKKTTVGINDFGQLDLKNGQLTGFIRLGFNNPTDTTIRATIDRVYIRGNEVLGHGRVTPRKVTLHANTLSQVDVDLSIPLANSIAFFSKLKQHTLDIVFNVLGRQFTISTPMSNLIQ